MTDHADIAAQVPQGRSRPPLAGAGLWLEVMTAAEWRCQCPGDCGRLHTSGQGHGSGYVCGVEDRPGAALHVVPRDLDCSDTAAVQLPAEQLHAMCSRCRTDAQIAAAKQARRRRADRAAAQQMTLFGGDDR